MRSLQFLNSSAKKNGGYLYRINTQQRGGSYYLGLSEFTFSSQYRREPIFTDSH